MSQLWRDQIYVFLAPERLDWVHYRRGFKPVQLNKDTVFCEQMQNGSPWQNALKLLESHLTDVTSAELTVILSNHFVRFVTLQPQAEITTPEEVKSYAAFRMREIYAERSESWDLSVSDWNPTTGAICAAINRDLMDRLQEITKRSEVKLKAVEPYLAAAYDHWQKQLNSQKSYFVVVESGRFCSAIVINGVWQSIRNQRVLSQDTHELAEELVVALDQEAVLLGNKEITETVYVFAPEYPQLVLPSNCGWLMVMLSDAQNPAPSHFPSSPADVAGIKQCLV
ncbi:MAG: hypothetical protein V9E86_04630 [Nitrosomonas sp.]